MKHVYIYKDDAPWFSYNNIRLVLSASVSETSAVAVNDNDFAHSRIVFLSFCPNNPLTKSLHATYGK